MNWEEVKVNAAIAAMQANLSNPDLLQAVTASEVVTRTCAEKCAKVSVRYAEALVEELKKSVGTESDGGNAGTRKYERPIGFYRPYD